MTGLEIRQESATRYALIGELDMASAPDVDRTFSSRAPNTALELDLTDLTFIDSAGLHALVRLSSMMNGTGPLVLVNVSRQARRLFEVVGLDSLESLEVRTDG